jgi:Caspase domain
MAQNPDHYAIVIGIDLYPQLRALKAAEKDATQFALWLTSEEGGGLPAKNVKIIRSLPTNSNNPYMARPLQAEIDEALGMFGIEKEIRIGTRLYFYFSGHGFGPNFVDVGMLMANASIKRLGNSLGLLPYRLFFRDTEAFDEVVFILDCCRDPHGGIEPLKPGFTPYRRGDGTKSQDFVVIGAMYGDESYQPLISGTKERRGLLTQAILEGLQKPEHADGLGRFTSSSLAYYIKNRVPELAAEADVDQTPNVDTTQLKKEIIFSTIPLSKLEVVSIQIIAPAGLKGDLVLSDTFGNEIIREPAAKAVAPSGWTFNLIRNRWYRVRLYPAPPNPKPNLIDLTEFTGTTYVHQFKR